MMLTGFFTHAPHDLHTPRACRQLSPKGREAVLARGVDIEQIREAADLEELFDLAGDPAQHELAAGLLGLLRRQEQGAEARAADVGQVLEIPHQAPASGLDEADHPVPEFLRRRAVDSPPGVQNDGVPHTLFGKFHDFPPESLGSFGPLPFTAPPPPPPPPPPPGGGGGGGGAAAGGGPPPPPR